MFLRAGIKKEVKFGLLWEYPFKSSGLNVLCPLILSCVQWSQAQNSSMPGETLGFSWGRENWLVTKNWWRDSEVDSLLSKTFKQLFSFHSRIQKSLTPSGPMASGPPGINWFVFFLLYATTCTLVVPFQVCSCQLYDVFCFVSFSLSFFLFLWAYVLFLFKKLLSF